MHTFRLKWPTTCADCGEWIPADTKVTFVGDKIAHASCPGLKEIDLGDAQVCASCHMIHGTSQKECW